MPCLDITENLLFLCEDEVIQKYALRKNTCGAKIGNQSLLQSWLRHYRCDQILAMHMDEFLQDFHKKYPDEPADEFILLKHFHTIQRALRVIAGGDTATPQDDMILDRYEVKDNKSVASLFVTVAVDATDNPGCGPSGCGSENGGGCSTPKK